MAKTSANTGDQFFTVDERARLVQTIRKMEQYTSGEIRLFVESKNPFVDPLDRAAQIFDHLKMSNTEQRNAVLIYLAVKHREAAIYADEGIYNQLGKDYWVNEMAMALKDFSSDRLVDGLEKAITHIGEVMVAKYPYNSETDKNELPDDIVFGD